MKKLLSILLLAVSSVTFAGTEGYLVDQNNQIVKSGTGLCWHTGYWTPANAVEGCDAVAKAAPAGAKITLNADMLFAFDKATLTKQGEEILNNLVVTSLTFSSLEAVAVIGYTDRIGSDKYNLALSQRRAETVQRYLISRHVPADIIVAEGRGKANPVTGNQCKGPVNAKLIACLQPDRRAVIELIGIK